MTSVTKDFKNEFGNDIQVSVDVEHRYLGPDRKVSFSMFDRSWVGAYQVFEPFQITRVEAENLRDSLVSALLKDDIS